MFMRNTILISKGLIVLLTAGYLTTVFSQTSCPAFTYVKTNTVDPNWPDSTIPKWPSTASNAGYPYFTRYTLPLPASSAQNCVQLPTGFSKRLWATEDQNMSGVHALVAMNWDEKGRLWGVETSDYPNRVLSNPMPGGGGSDRIVILEDTDGDGVADRRKIFASGYNLLTGIVVTTNGVIVSMAPNILLLKDDNGDDVADNPQGQILYTGFGRSDTHATISNLTYGLDNWIYASIGYSAGTNIRNPTTNQTFSSSWSQRIMRFKSDGSAIEAQTSLTNNTWGIGISETGQIFASTANRDHSFHEVYPGQSHRTPIYSGADQGYVPETPVYSSWTSVAPFAHPHPITPHWNINNPGYAGSPNHSLYTARQFPQKYWDRIAFVCGPQHHLVHQMFLSPYRSTWRGAEDTTEPNIFASTDPSSAPIQATVGPDGALWVLDWYNYLTNHNGICGKIACGTGAAQISPIRDTTRTRIYRISYDARPLDAILNLSQASEDQLIETFGHPNLFWRLQAQRLLLKRGANAGLITKLTNILSTNTVNDMGESPQVIHALRTLEGFGLFTSAPSTWVPILKDLMLHPSPGVRWNAIDALPNNALSTTAILDQGRINDPNAHVRIRALYKLSILPGTKSGQMYTPYVNLDAGLPVNYSQNRFTAVGGLTQTSTLPTIPPLRDPVSINGKNAPVFQGEISVTYRNGLEIRGINFASGTLTIWNAKGIQVARLSVAGGKVAERAALAEGVYSYTINIQGAIRTGRFSVFE